MDEGAHWLPDKQLLLCPFHLRNRRCQWLRGKRCPKKRCWLWFDEIHRWGPDGEPFPEPSTGNKPPKPERQKLEVITTYTKVKE